MGNIGENFGIFSYAAGHTDERQMSMTCLSPVLEQPCPDNTHLAVSSLDSTYCGPFQLVRREMLSLTIVFVT